MTIAPSQWNPWPTSTVGAEFDIQLGKMLDAARNVGQPKPYLGNRAVQWGRIDTSAAGVVPLTRADQIRYRLRHGDLLVCEGGEVGRGAIWKDELRECYYQKALHRLRSKASYDVRIMLAFLEYWSITGRFANYVTQTSIAHLPRDKFVLMPLPAILPPEQRAIAGALSDADNLIASLERLIAKKQAIKQGMMQQLLTGKTRLPGFTEPWKVVVFEQLAAPTRERTDPRAVPAGMRLVELEHIESAGGRLLASSTAQGAASLKTIFQPGDVLFGKLRAYLRKFWLADSSGICSTEIWALRTKPGADSGYVRYLVETDRFIEAASGSYGTHMPRSDWGTLKGLEFEAPSFDEQKAIMSVLRDADNEIQILQDRLSKTNAVKQGLVQQLLTGRTRLPVKEAVS
jgi:type I restriction enzyme S subunit